MSDDVKPTEARRLHTVPSLAEGLRACGVAAGMTVIVHSSMKQIGGWICGGAEAVVLALMQVLTPNGTLMMPTHTTNNTDPRYWRRPSVPAEWWQAIRDHYPPYDPASSVTRNMGIIPETFRKYDGVRRSSHPIASFAAWGKHAAYLTHMHPLDAMFGKESPLARLVELDGSVFLLGVGHSNNTLLHLAEEHAHYAGKVRVSESSCVLVDGVPQRVTFSMIDYDDADFADIGEAYERDGQPYRLGKLGDAVTRLVPARSLLAYAVGWMEANRGT